MRSDLMNTKKNVRIVIELKQSEFQIIQQEADILLLLFTMKLRIIELKS